MVKRHLSRLNAPKTWPIKRKSIKFVTRPNPGAHTLKTSMPINLIIIKFLKAAKTTSEVKKVLHQRKVMVNKKIITDYKHAVGLFDVIEIVKTKESYRMLFDKNGKFMLKKVKDAESNIKPYKIVGKTIIKKGKVQLNLDDGTNLLVKKDDYKINDTIVLTLDKKEIKAHLPFEKGALIYMKGGKKVASVAKLVAIKTFKGLQPDDIVFKTKEGDFETRKDYAMVIGKDKPVIDVEP